MRIAIVGAGVAGLAAAARLHPEHDVTVFEADAHVGGHALTVPVPDSAVRASLGLPAANARADVVHQADLGSRLLSARCCQRRRSQQWWWRCRNRRRRSP